MSAVPNPIEAPETERGPHWVSKVAFPVVNVSFYLSQLAVGLAVYHSNYWLAVPLVLLSSHLMHGMLIGFHEASHGLLRKSKWFNEVDGVAIGVFSLTSFSLYRAAHQLHHAYLSTERDDELWPFNLTTSPRWLRVTAAIVELTMGMFFTPWLFLRTFFRKNSPIRNRKLRRRIWMEMGITVVVWALVLAGVAYFGVWKYFLWLYFIPAWLAGNMQSVRKYIEHVGLTGNTVNGSTRSIVADSIPARIISFSLLHEPFHGVHHWRPGLEHCELPLHPEALEPKVEGERPPFATYYAAFYDLFINLGDPKVGAQWLGQRKLTRREQMQQGLI